MDALATLASLVQISKQQDHYEFLMEDLLYLGHDSPDSRIICQLVSLTQPAMDISILNSRTTLFPQTYPKIKKCNFIQQSAHYALIDDTLYRRGLNGTLLRYVECDESEKALQEVHEGICVDHSNNLALEKKLVRIGYYWPTMEKYSFQFFK